MGMLGDKVGAMRTTADRTSVKVKHIAIRQEVAIISQEINQAVATISQETSQVVAITTIEEEEEDTITITETTVAVEEHKDKVTIIKGGEEDITTKDNTTIRDNKIAININQDAAIRKYVRRAQDRQALLRTMGEEQQAL